MPRTASSTTIEMLQQQQNLHCWIHGGATCQTDMWHTRLDLQWPSWKLKKSRTAAEAGNYFRDREYGRPVEGLIVTEDGHCADEMNRNIWCECCCASTRSCAGLAGSGTLVS